MEVIWDVFCTSQIAKEQGLEVLPEHDPIRDQSWYVNKKLRQRLFEEYGVKTCTVIQFLGDAIILPAGALHQVMYIKFKAYKINYFLPKTWIHLCSVTFYFIISIC